MFGCGEGALVGLVVFPELAATGLTDPAGTAEPFPAASPPGLRISPIVSLASLPCSRWRDQCQFAFANVCDAANFDPGLSGPFGPEPFAFRAAPRSSQAGEGIATLEIGTSNLDSVCPTNLVRRKDLVLMPMPHSHRALVQPKASNS